MQVTVSSCGSELCATLDLVVVEEIFERSGGRSSSLSRDFCIGEDICCVVRIALS